MAHLYTTLSNAASNPAPPTPRPEALPPAAAAWRSLLTPLAILAVVASAWLTGRLAQLSAGSDAGYWLGVCGGLMMLALFGYPLRKRLPVMRRAGPTRRWFIAHMALGAAGPWLILVHCNFRIGSLNAAVALVSMLVVAASGVVGRFLYVRIHRGLTDQKRGLAELQAALAHGQTALRDGLAEVPRAAERLLAFQARMAELQAGVSPWRALGAGWAASRVLRAVRADIALAMREGPHAPAGRAEQRRLERLWREQARAYVGQVLQVARYAGWERLFAWWHVLHIPFVYVMVVCAVVHVVAVHAY